MRAFAGFLISVLLISAVLCGGAAAETGHTHITSGSSSYTVPADSADYCLVCDVAAKINALPAAADISVDNAAAVIDQIHAIERLTPDIYADDEGDNYSELLDLVENGNDGSGYGQDVPLRYINAVTKIRELGGNTLLVSKKFVAEDGSTVDASGAMVQFTIESTDSTGFVPLTVTLSSMSAMPNSLSYDADFYSADSDGNGWTYTYILPA